MNVASLDLCKELYELSGQLWDGTWLRHVEGNSGVFVTDTEQAIANDYDDWCPAYDLGYLLRKLPPLQLVNKGIWFITTIDKENRMLVHAEAETAEDAAAQLTIELFKQGVLKHD